MLKLLESPDNVTITKAPDGKELPAPVRLSYASGHGTFCVIGNDSVVVSSRSSTHPTIYNGLKGCSKSPPSGWKKILRDYTTEILTGTLTQPILDDFMVAFYKEHGNPRYEVPSGRVWRGMFIKSIGRFNVISFWMVDAELRRHESIIKLLTKAYKMHGPVYIETIDSKPSVRDKDAQPTVGAFRSKIAPHLTQKQLIDIMSRAHSAPHTLSPLERKVAAELRAPAYGDDKQADAARRAGLDPAARYNFTRIFGDSHAFTSIFD